MKGRAWVVFFLLFSSLSVFVRDETEGTGSSFSIITISGCSFAYPACCKSWCTTISKFFSQVKIIIRSNVDIKDSAASFPLHYSPGWLCTSSSTGKSDWCWSTTFRMLQLWLRATKTEEVLLFSSMLVVKSWVDQVGGLKTLCIKISYSKPNGAEIRIGSSILAEKSRVFLGAVIFDYNWLTEFKGFSCSMLNTFRFWAKAEGSVLK